MILLNVNRLDENNYKNIYISSSEYDILDKSTVSVNAE
jgi:hypothetical protein